MTEPLDGEASVEGSTLPVYDEDQVELSRPEILQREASVSLTEIEAFSGPLPHPGLFAHYERVLPGSAERILRMTEKSLDHSIHIEQQETELRSHVLRSTVRTQTRAQWFTFVIVVVFMALAAYSLFLDQPLGAVAGGLAAIGTIAFALRGKGDGRDESEPPDEKPQSEDG